MKETKAIYKTWHVYESITLGTTFFFFHLLLLSKTQVLQNTISRNSSKRFQDLFCFLSNIRRKSRGSLTYTLSCGLQLCLLWVLLWLSLKLLLISFDIIIKFYEFPQLKFMVLSKCYYKTNRKSTLRVTGADNLACFFFFFVQNRYY